MLRRLVVEGNCTLAGLSRSLRMSIPIVDQVFKHMRQQQLVEVKGMIGNDYHFVLSAAGKQLASERFQVSQYAGACPVSLKDYHAAVKAQAAKVNVDRQTLRNAFSDLVVTDPCWTNWVRRSFRRTRSSFTGPPATAKPAWRSACCGSIRTRC